MKKSFILRLLLIVFITISISSCEGWKKNPDYVGSWQFNEQISSDNIVYNTTRTIVFSKNAYEETYTVKRENSTVITAIIGTSGTLKVTHSTMIFELKELGTCDLDESEICTGDILWYGDGTPFWHDNIEYFEETVSGVYQMIGSNLHLTRDLNGDGDYADNGEDVTFEMI